MRIRKAIIPAAGIMALIKSSMKFAVLLKNLNLERKLYVNDFAGQNLQNTI